ncbi:hypothetical protein Cs7R123_22770 [Catellatospora sp. TT07R-123]|uniref:hypothetical protein n=1 Tax=Catellatospora sp. TT07R-123 TaxID=2733863 RepID=UPI001B09362E|nr:hypothetical protein [Catellatospora sp. TT07R-123]GHJ44935.1 hypothetical protein Cs7R123_22770 [Catellatospora sp. TT07R-123]
MSGDEIPVRHLSWPPGDGTHLDPDTGRDAGRRMFLAGQEVSGLRDGLGARIEAAGGARPWGNDDSGKQIQQNYEQIGPAILAMWRMVGEAMQSMGVNITAAANETTGTDIATSENVDKAGTRHPDIPV